MAPIIGYVCEANPFHDKTSWSGLIYKIRESIENSGCEVVWIPCRPNTKLAKLLRLWNEFWHGKNTMFYHTNLCYRLYASSIDMNLVEKCDILFFPGASQMCKFRDFGKPIINYSDSNFRIMCNYYWDNVTNWQFEVGDKLEQAAIDHSRIVIRAAHWASDSVINDYKYPAEHTYVLRFGANLDDCDISINQPYTAGRLNILFSGVDWKRKGGDIAVKTAELLSEKGIDVKLHIVGIRHLPEEYQNHPLINFVGFLNKTNKEQYKRYVEVVKNSHILLLPTRAECAGIVFGECSAYGIPIYTFDTGGIPDYVENGVNGYRINYNQGASAFADKIIESLTPETQKTLHDGCLKMYADKLNWKVWSKEFREILVSEGLWK